MVGGLALWLVGAALSAPVHVRVGAPPPELRAIGVHFPSGSQATIAAWYGAPAPGSPTIVLAHGVRGSRWQLSQRAQFIRDAGYGVLLYDAQGHGESIGSHITFGFLEAHDAQAAVEFVRERNPNSKIGFIGLSLGGAAALLGERPLPVEALVLEAVYPTLEEAVVNRISLRLGSFLAEILSHLLLWQVEPRLGFDPYKLNPIDRIASVTAPILLIAGSEDRYTLLEDSEALFQAAGQPKKLWVVNGATHQDLHRFAGREYERRVLEFLHQHLGAMAAHPGLEAGTELLGSALLDPWGVKDSYSSLPLDSAGFALLFEGSWIWREPTGIERRARSSSEWRCVSGVYVVKDFRHSTSWLGGLGGVPQCRRLPIRGSGDRVIG